MGIKKGGFKDITGQKFGRLTALHRLHNTKGRMSKWLCVCECGNFVEVRLNSLTSGLTKSCGCLKKDNHYVKHSKKNTRLYRTWKSMKSRCYNNHVDRYPNYGGRGIKVCDEWLNDFMSFYNWAMANGYDDKLTIDRINVDGNYEPNNCRWVDMKQQLRNTQRNAYYTINYNWM